MDLSEELSSLRSMRFRDLIHQITSFAIVLSLAAALYTTQSFLTNCPHAMVVVMSGSMEPGYYRGDVLFLHARPEYPVEVGDIIVYRLPARDVPIVHRVHRVHVRESDSKRLFLTKGDNNMYDDRVIYDEGTEWVEEDFIIGKSYGYIPRLGYITLMFNESRICKILTLFLLGFFAITANDT